MSEPEDDLDALQASTQIRLGGRALASVDSSADLSWIGAQPSERYEVGARLGEGGMGEVNLCFDRVIGREVALKVVLASQADRDELRARFVREARVQGQLEHPSIVPVYDFGAEATGRLFFTMKRVRGVTLEQVLEKLRTGDDKTARTYTLHKLLGAFVQVCLAVDYAHQRGVVHRDLKPSNVMLGAYGEVYVLDWGVAKLAVQRDSLRSLSVSGGVETTETAAGAMLGTPGYMAPEQISGGAVDARSDVYALGCILFEILTLERLHGEGNAAAMLSRALQGADARASVRAPERDVAPELEEACVAACAKKPADRLPSARRLSEAVEAYLAGDRDVELRRSLARGHLDRARAAKQRPDALREAGRALALAPTDPEALDLLTSLLTTPPAVPPSEVLDAVENARLEAQRLMLPRVAFAYACAWIVFFVVPALLGMLHGWVLALPLAGWSLACVLAIVAYRRFGVFKDRMWSLIAASSTAIALSSVVFGPLVLVPSMVLTNALSTVLVTRRDRRAVVLVLNALALLVPSLLAWAGHHPVTHDVSGLHALSIGTEAFTITRNTAFAWLVTMHVALFALGAMFSSRYRDTLTAAETDRQLHAWQLRQVVAVDPATRLSRAP